MEPIKFKEANCELKKPSDMTDEECSSLPVYRDGRDCISCWKLSFIERFRALIFGRIWLGVLNGWTQPPVRLWARKTVFYKKTEEPSND
ncbi:hypothetical protein SDC9_142193 [bioreactor metagenome]|uniref:Uncharacterized protein n=1 Tax=bioreactor metagenome TaxID=1076179 RepID=A0A645E3A1_9ZZZZ